MDYAKSLIAAASGPALAIALAAAPAHAAGVTAGTLIENTATATYESGAASVTVQSNTVTVRVDELLDVAVASLNGSPVPIGQSSAVLSYTVTNTGNGPEAYLLSANPTTTGNDFDAVVQSIAIDSNGNGIYDAGVDQVIAAGAATPVIAPDASLTVFVIASAPSGASDGSTSQLRLAANAATGTGSAGTIFTGTGSGGGDAVVGASTAQDDALGGLIASLATVTLAKSAAIADPFGGQQPVPGAVVTYTLVATVAGTGTTANLHVTDVIPAGTTYQPASLKLEGAALSDAADGDAGVGGAAGIDVALGTITGGTTRTVKFNVKIN